MKKIVKFLIADIVALTTMVGAQAGQMQQLSAKDYIYMIVHHSNELNKPTNIPDKAFKELDRLIDKE